MDRIFQIPKPIGAALKRDDVDLGLASGHSSNFYCRNHTRKQKKNTEMQQRPKGCGS